MPYAAALYRDTWLPHDREPVIYDGITCCMYVAVFEGGEIRVELLPEDENETEEWPVDVLALPMAKQHDILSQLQ